MRVAEVVLDHRFLTGTHAIEYCRRTGHEDAYYISQVSIVDARSIFMVCRYRKFMSVVSDPMPVWRSCRGTGADKYGFYGLWLPHLSDLLAECNLVPLSPTDRPNHDQ